MTVSYQLTVANAKTHKFQLSLRISNPPQQLRVSLPVWIPGSYMVREFSQHLANLKAQQADQAISITQLDKCTWELSPLRTATPVELTWEVYAFDSSVRMAYLDPHRGFANGTSLFLMPHGFESNPCTLEVIIQDPDLSDWRCACALPAIKTSANQSLAAYQAQNYDQLVDSPIELGNFWHRSFIVAGVPHQIVVAGAPNAFDGERLLKDTQRICESVLQFWYGCKNVTPPYEQYIFMLNATSRDYGGLEHQASTALICKREDLPLRSNLTQPEKIKEGYQNLLTLICHEFFHVWNVKMMRPQELAVYDYSQENYTELLWFFEGMTSYYEYLLVYRASKLTKQQILSWLAKDVTALEGMPGRHLQSVAQASFEAWTKFYRRDANTINATISYYAKGAIIALCLDLTLRLEGHGTLDDVLRLLWNQYQNSTLTEKDILMALKTVGKRSFQPELDSWVHSTDELPYEELLEQVGICIEHQQPTLSQQLGLKVVNTAKGLMVQQVWAGSAAEKAGVAPQDELLAVNGWRLHSLEQWEVYVSKNGPSQLMIARDGKILILSIEMSSHTHGGVSLIEASEDLVGNLSPLAKAWLEA